ncbi:MAG: hypothetical protein KI792_13400 [Alphaproteobacteria bacterium]|nr:hypothetical protein [Alphaproteobacteria bacterium SS10]
MKPRYIRIRIAVLSIVMLLITASLVTVSVKWVISSFELASQIQEREAQTIFEASAAELNNTFGRAPAILNKFSSNMAVGAISYTDLDKLAVLFATELRNAPFLSWVSYGTREEGSFVGATRRGDDIVINMSVPSREQGRTQEWVFEKNGEWRPIEALVPARFDPRGREWFYQGYLRPGVSWTRPYEFREGGLGVTSVKAMLGGYPPSWVGTLTADFNINSIKQRLYSISSQFAGSLLLVVRGKEDVYVSIQGDDGPFISVLKDLSADRERLEGQGEIDIPMSSDGGMDRFFYAAFPLDIIEGLNKQVGTRMLASATTLEGSTVDQQWRSIGHYQFVGKSKPLEMFEALHTDGDEDRLDAFAACLYACRQSSGEAEVMVAAFTEKFGEDKALTLHLTQIKAGHGSDVILLHKK